MLIIWFLPLIGAVGRGEKCSYWTMLKRSESFVAKAIPSQFLRYKLILTVTYSHPPRILSLTNCLPSDVPQMVSSRLISEQMGEVIFIFF